MHIDKVTYSKIFSTSQFLNERIGIEIIVNAGEDAMLALKEAKNICQEFHKEANPELYKFNEKSLTAEETNAITEIGLCTTIEKLATYKGFLTDNTKPYYMEKLKQLTLKK